MRVQQVGKDGQGELADLAEREEDLEQLEYLAEDEAEVAIAPRSEAEGHGNAGQISAGVVRSIVTRLCLAVSSCKGCRGHQLGAGGQAEGQDPESAPGWKPRNSAQALAFWLCQKSMAAR